MKSLNMKLACLPETHGSIAEVRMNLGKVDFHRGAYTAAQESFAGALEVPKSARAHCYSLLGTMIVDNYRRCGVAQSVLWSSHCIIGF